MLLTIIVILENVSDGLDGHGVGVLKPLSVVVMQRLVVIWIAIAHGEVDGDNKVQTQASADVVKEGGILEERPHQSAVTLSQ